METEIVYFIPPNQRPVILPRGYANTEWFPRFVILGTTDGPDFATCEIHNSALCAHVWR